MAAKLSGAAAMRPVVFITGASSGIGAAAVEVFAEAGYDVIAAARRMERLEQIAHDVAAQHPVQVLPLVCDVNFDISVEGAFKSVALFGFGRLDVLVNNAGIGGYGSIEQAPLEVFKACMETNYFGALRCTQSALPFLRRTAADRPGRFGAAIVMVSSFVGRRAMPGFSAYCASKFALEGLSESLRIELADYRISVSVINPGVTETDFGKNAIGKRPDKFLVPRKRMGAETVARAILRAVEHPRRNQFLTTAGKFGAAVDWLSPGLLDVILRRRFSKKH